MTEQSTIPGLFCFFIVFVSMGARRVELDCAGPPHWRGSPSFSGANAGSAHSTRRTVSVSCFCRFSLSLSLSLSLLLCLSLFPVSFPLSDIKRNFVPRKRFKRYERGLKTCFVRGKRFRRNKTMCDVDDLVIVRMDARRVELDCAGPPHWRGSPPFSGANAGSAHSAGRACTRCCYFTGSKKLKWTRP